MLNYRNTTIVFVLVLAALVIFTNGLLLVLAVLFLVLLYSLLLFYGSYYVNSQFFMKVLCSAKTDQKQIAISFDDGPANNFSNEILAILQSRQVPAAFFCIGKRISEHPDLLKQIIAEGHIVGNHSFSHHFWFDLFGQKKMLADIEGMSDSVKKITGLYPILFRPPYGVTTPIMKKVLAKGNFTAVGWNIRSLDTVIKDEKKLANKIIGSLQPGAVLLLHDTSASCLKALPAILDEVSARGYEWVRLDKLLNLQPYA